MTPSSLCQFLPDSLNFFCAMIGLSITPFQLYMRPGLLASGKDIGFSVSTRSSYSYSALEHGVAVVAFISGFVFIHQRHRNHRHTQQILLVRLAMTVESSDFSWEDRSFALLKTFGNSLHLIHIMRLHSCLRHFQFINATLAQAIGKQDD